MAYRDDFRDVQREAWWTLPRVLLALLVLTVAGFGFTFISDAFNLFSFRFWGVKQENARRQVYEQSKSYRQGSVQRLSTLCTQVKDADDDHKPMLNDVIAHEFAEWNMSDVPDYLQSCLANAREK
jgi:hypothetical protein